MNTIPDQLQTEKLMQIFLSYCEREEHKKHTLLLRAGEICRKLYFIEKGILRFYYIDESGQDITHWFQFEHKFITEIESFFEKKASDYFIETLEDCTLYSVSLENLNQAAATHPEIEKLWNLVTTYTLIELGEKIKDLQFRDAKTRYLNLQVKHPDILQRVSLGYIASYLGITQQSLSRIRKQQ